MYELSVRSGFREHEPYCISGPDLRTICGLQTETETPADGEASLSEMTVCFQFPIPADFLWMAA